jgi:hypothetical protein
VVAVALTTPNSKTTVVVVEVAVEVHQTTLITEDLMGLILLSKVLVEVSAARQIFLVVTQPLILVLVVVVVLTTAQITMVALVVLALWSSDTKSELCLNDKLLYGGF